jgi:aryl-alcohol dehydrogenase-like predicted oxidoreductase
MTPSTARAATDNVGKAYYAKAEEADRDVVDRVGEIAEQRGLPRAQIALAWLLRKPGVTAPIVGATKPAQFEDAVGALSVRLSDEEIARLEAPYVPHPISGHE